MKNCEDNLGARANPIPMAGDVAQSIDGNNAKSDISVENALSTEKDETLAQPNFEIAIKKLYGAAKEKLKEARKIRVERKIMSGCGITNAELGEILKISKRSIKLMEEAICLLKEAKAMSTTHGDKLYVSSAIKLIGVFEAILSNWKTYEKQLPERAIPKKTVMERIIEMNQRNKRAEKEEYTNFHCCQTCTKLAMVYRSKPSTSTNHRDSRLAERLKNVMLTAPLDSKMAEELMLKIHEVSKNRKRAADLGKVTGTIGTSLGTVAVKKSVKLAPKIVTEQTHESISPTVQNAVDDAALSAEDSTALSTGESEGSQE